MKQKKWKMPRKLSMVKFDEEKRMKEYPFTKNEPYIFLGEIPNMRGHCIVISHRTGKVLSGYHTDNFIEMSEDET